MLDGVLFFPVTPFAADGAVDAGALAEHVRRGLGAGPGGIFAACGTGEFHALAPEEHQEVVRTAVTAAGGQVPVFVGAGGPLPTAVRLARGARDAGASGLLLMPPYLVQGPPAGLVAYTEAVAALPTVAGFKDGTGDLDLLGQIVTAVRESLPDKPFQFFNGMPTAEVTVQAYRGIGVGLYSSAVFCFAPELSLAFYRAVTGDDAMTAHRLLADFFHPLVRLRNKVPGYAVSLVKAGVGLCGLDVGGVRPPLTDPPPEHLAELRRILDAGQAVVAT